MKLKPFSEKPVCPKCGSAEIHSEWHPQAEDRDFWLDCRDMVQEHIDRYCSTCHYEWYEHIKASRGRVTEGVITSTPSPATDRKEER